MRVAGTGLHLRHPCARGFTLIEIAVTLTLTVAATLVAAPLAVAWVDSSRVVETRAVLQQAVSRAKAMALRNSAGVTGDTPAATLCAVQGVVHVHQGLPAQCGDGSAWRQDIPGGARTQVLLDGAALGCLALANTGRPVPLAFGGADCAEGMAFEITRGDERVAGQLH